MLKHMGLYPARKRNRDLPVKQLASKTQGLADDFPLKGKSGHANPIKVPKQKGAKK